MPFSACTTPNRNADRSCPPSASCAVATAAAIGRRPTSSEGDRGELRAGLSASRVRQREHGGSCDFRRLRAVRGRPTSLSPLVQAVTQRSRHMETNHTKQRLHYKRVAPGVYAAMDALDQYLSDCGLEESLLHLIRLRASQINGCAYCVDMHWKDLRALGETEQRLSCLDVWRESPFYSARERAALAWIWRPEMSITPMAASASTAFRIRCSATCGSTSPRKSSAT